MSSFLPKIIVGFSITAFTLLTGCLDGVNEAQGAKGLKCMPIAISLRNRPDVDTIADWGEVVVYAADMVDSIYAPLNVNESTLYGRIENVPVGRGRIVEISIYNNDDSLYFKSLDTVNVEADNETYVYAKFKKPDEIEKEKMGTIIIIDNGDTTILKDDDIAIIVSKMCDSSSVSKLDFAEFLKNNDNLYDYIYNSEWFSTDLVRLQKVIGGVIKVYKLDDDIEIKPTYWDPITGQIFTEDQALTYKELFGIIEPIADSFDLLYDTEVNWTSYIPVEEKYLNHPLTIQALKEKMTDLFIGIVHNSKTAAFTEDEIMNLYLRIAWEVYGIKGNDFETVYNKVGGNIFVNGKVWLKSEREQLTAEINKVMKEYQNK